MNIILSFLILMFAVNESYGVIYKLNASDYERMPPLYKMDDYNSCLQAPSDLYCTVRFNLVADEPNELFHMIKEYSEHYKSHFDHTNLRYGVCPTRNCKKYIENETSVSEAVLEGCLNQTFWENYQLKTRIKHYSCHGLSDRTVTIDNGDIFTGVIILVLIMLSVVGSLYDIFFAEPADKNIILSFSLKRNWKSLKPSKSKSDSRYENLKGLNGMKCLMEYGVILVHSGFIYYILGDNIHDVELSYYNAFYQFVINLSPLMQFFFVISAFLMTYNLEISCEKRPLTWSSAGKMIFKRYMRLTPAYAFIILVLSTWFKFLGPGPMWEATQEIGLLDCKDLWWTNLLYFNNCIYNYRCLLSSWSNAADMQLYIFGILLYMYLKNNKNRNTILLTLTVIGSIMVGIHTYAKDLYFGMYFAPETVKTLFENDPTFNGTYKSAHGNFSSYVIGIALGYFIYQKQQTKIDMTKYSKYRFIYWTVLPLVIVIMFSGSLFFGDSPREPLYIRTIYAALIKPAVGSLAAIHIIGMVFKLENVYRKFFESEFWAMQSKLAYGAYLLHLPYLLIFMNIQSNLLHMTMFNIMLIFISVSILSFASAIPLYLFIEAPFTEVAKHLTSPRREAVTNGKCKKVE